MDITKLSGVGPARAAAFEKLNIGTAEELLRLYPHRYEDIGNIVEISSLAAYRGQKVTLRVTVCGAVSEKRLSGSRMLTNIPVGDDSGATVISYFNNRFIKSALSRAETLYFYGKVAESGRPTLYNPELFYKIDESARLLPVYPLVSGLSQKVVRKTVAEALRTVDSLQDPLPEQIRGYYKLCGLAEALHGVHAPKTELEIQTARRRLVFEELLCFSLGLAMMRSGQRQRAAVVVKDFPSDFISAHDFEPTKAQKKTMQDIYSDLSGGFAMHRLLQGDVGSGKTLVAGQAAFCVIRAGGQAAVMAPTEVLANQHYRYFEKMLSPLGISTALLTSSVKASDKQKIKRGLKEGTVDLVIGTHAVLSSDVEFAKLGLVVTDEQHRFGVSQRAQLSKKGEGAHVLVMSATPIPRTLALMLWGDLDLSVIDSLPAGRQRVKSFLVTSAYKKRLYAFIQKQIAEGGRVYYVCPAVEEDDEGDMADVNTRVKELAALAGENNVGVVHGRLKPALKDRAMTAFAAGDIQVLVSTTVIEVGVNVPEATLMIIENAERFGLSQLHQLRGRVGRGSAESFCVLISDSTGKQALERMRYFCKTTDGFEIARRDLELRGPGNFFGIEQHGLVKMRIADRGRDMEIFKNAADCARAILKKEGGISRFPPLESAVSALFSAYGVD